MRWQYLTFEEQNAIRFAKTKPVKPAKKKLDIEAIKVNLPTQEEKLFSAKNWVDNLKKNKIKSTL